MERVSFSDEGPGRPQSLDSGCVGCSTEGVSTHVNVVPGPVTVNGVHVAGETGLSQLVKVETTVLGVQLPQPPVGPTGVVPSPYPPYEVSPRGKTGLA
jgi:hypothetical protein